MRDIPKWPVLFRTVKFMKDKETRRKYSTLKENKETLQLDKIGKPELCSRLGRKRPIKGSIGAT